MRKFIISGLMLFSVLAHSKTKVAVIDSGYNGPVDKLCYTGHYDFVHDRPGIGADYRGNHGTSMVKTIIDHAGPLADYCIIVYKVLPGFRDEMVNPQAKDLDIPKIISSAVLMAAAENVKVMNISISGLFPSEAERNSLTYASFKGITGFIAAGNDRHNLSKECNSFPACYKIPKMFVVGTYETGTIANYDGGPYKCPAQVIDVKEAFCYDGQCGTSVSSAIAVGKFIRRLK